jgi:transcriptional regulator with XRE-family HTH domain
MFWTSDIPVSPSRARGARTAQRSGTPHRRVLSRGADALPGECRGFSCLPGWALDVTETFGERLRRLRTERGMTVVDLAGSLGVVEGTIRQLESGAVKWPSFQLGLRIAAHLDVDPRYLALGEQPSMSDQFEAMEKRLAKLEQRVASLAPKRR